MRAKSIILSNVPILLSSSFIRVPRIACYRAPSSQKMSYSVCRERDGTIVVSPKDEVKQTATVVICHGLGDTAEGFEDVAQNMIQQLPYARFILPTAPRQPVTMNMGMAMPSWYDIVGLDERSNEKCRGIDMSMRTISDLLEKEHVRGIPYNRMVLAGFSQGGALSIFTGFQLPVEKKIAGILVMSGYLPGKSHFHLTRGLEDVPVLHLHGTMDPLVKVEMAEKSKDLLTSMGATHYTLKTFPIQHTVSPQEIVDALSFLAKVLPPEKSAYIKLKDPTEMSVKELKEAIKKAGLGPKAVGFMEKKEFIALLQEHRSNANK